MKHSLVQLGTRLLAAVSATVALMGAESPDPPSETAATSDLTDLSLGNLFSAGWNEPWSRRPRPDHTPDLTLLRVQSNMLLRSSRTDYSFEEDTDASVHDHSQFVGELVEYSFNRRLMLAVLGNYQWIRDKDGATRQGGA